MKLQIIYEDEYLMVIDKPFGLVVEPSQTQKNVTLAEILQQDYGITIDRGGIVHRLDKDTSGLLLVAKSEEILLKLQAQFKERTVKKEYLALVHGYLEENVVVSLAIGRNPGDREKFTVFKEESDIARSAETKFVPEQRLRISEDQINQLFGDLNKVELRKLIQNRYPQFTLVRAFPLTGRTHQIRVHLKSLGFPIAGDETYGGRKLIRLDKRWINRQFLHAAKLLFTHPVNNKIMELESELPKDLQDALLVLEKV